VEKYIWTNPIGLYYIWKNWGDSNSMRGGFSQRERHGLRLGATVELDIWDPSRVTHMIPSLNPVLKDTTEYRPSARRSATSAAEGRSEDSTGSAL